MVPPLHGERLRGYGWLIREIAQEVTREWKPGTLFGARATMQELTLRVMSRVAFGLDEGPCLQELRDRLRVLLDSAISPWSIVALSRLPQRDSGTSGECVEKVRWLLAHGPEREAIARAGQQRCLAQHTHRHRVPLVDAVIREALARVHPLPRAAGGGAS